MHGLRDKEIEKISFDCQNSERRFLRHDIDPPWKSIRLSGKERRQRMSLEDQNISWVLSVCMSNM